MYYSSGTYEAFAHPEKPKDVDKKSAYIIGTGLAGLAAAFYLVRDGQMKGEHIHLLEKLELAGGSCDGEKDVTKGFYMRGGREMDNHFEVMWDMFRDVPSIETPGVSVLDEYYWLNKHDPNYSLCRASINRGQDAHTDKKFKLDKESAMALSTLFITPEKDLEGKKISDVLPDSFWSTNFWLYWQTMFAFQRWSSALEMKRYLCRYVHHIDGLPDFSALRFTKYNQYESMILPLVKYLESHGVKIEFGMDVKNVVIEDKGGKKIAKQIVYVKDGKEQSIDLIEDDLVFITNGCCTDTSCYGDQNTAPDLSGIKNGCGESWDLWKNIAKQAKHGEYGNPDAFCNDVEATNWMSATVQTSDEEIIKHIINVCKRDPREGKVTTGGIVTVKDSTKNWYLSWTINRQPQFKAQDKNSVLVWLYALNTKRAIMLKRQSEIARAKKFAVNGFITSALTKVKLITLQKTPATQQPAICHISTLSSSQEKRATDLRLCLTVQLTLRSSVSSQKRREIQFSQPNTQSEQVWKACIHFLMLTVACLKFGAVNTM